MAERGAKAQGDDGKSGEADVSTEKSRQGAAGSRKADEGDAIEMLKADHRRVEQLFEDYEGAQRRNEKKRLVKQICDELTIHALLEEEIFYPACRDHMDDDALDEAQVEHDSAKTLILQLLEGAPTDPYYDAKVKVLSELIKHHVKEEEQRAEGIFAKAKAGGVDTDEIAEQLKARKEELVSQAAGGSLEKPQLVSVRKPEGEQRAGGRRASEPEIEDRGRRSGRDTDSDRRYASERHGRAEYSPAQQSRSGEDRRDRHSRLVDEEEDRARSDRFGRDDREEELRGRRGRRAEDENEYERAAYSGGRAYDYEDRGEWFDDHERRSEAARRGWGSRRD